MKGFPGSCICSFPDFCLIIDASCATNESQDYKEVL